MKKVLFLILSLSMALILVSCTPKVNGTDSEVNAPSSAPDDKDNEDDETIMYTNITSDETKNDLKKTLIDKGLDENDVNFFMNNVDEYNDSADANELASKFLSLIHI